MISLYELVGLEIPRHSYVLAVYFNIIVFLINIKIYVSVNSHRL